MVKKMETNDGTYMQQSIRFSADQVRWLGHQADQAGVSFNAVVRQLVEDARTMFSLPPTMAEALEKERSEMKLDFRRYVQELLTQRYRDMIRAEYAGGKGRK